MMAEQAASKRRHLIRAISIVQGRRRDCSEFSAVLLKNRVSSNIYCTFLRYHQMKHAFSSSYCKSPTWSRQTRFTRSDRLVNPTMFETVIDLRNRLLGLVSRHRRRTVYSDLLKSPAVLNFYLNSKHCLFRRYLLIHLLCAVVY